MLSFHTNIDRIQPWIKTLDVLYYENFGKEESEFRVLWSDEPPEWVDRESAANTLCIELHTIHEKQNTLLYKLTFFVTTGTIIVQGQKYKKFIDHFQLLTQILEQVIEKNISINAHRNTTTNEAHIDTDYNSETSETDTLTENEFDPDITVVKRAVNECDHLTPTLNQTWI